MKLKDKILKVLYRCSIKGRVNLSHLMALRELKKLQTLGYECQILISDLGAFLDNQKCPWAAIQVKEYSLKNFF